MVFSSIAFICYFLPCVLLLYLLWPHRNIVLLAASLFFYFWGEGYYVSILLVSIGGNYICGNLLDQAQGDSRRWLLGVGVAFNLSLLVYFKYAYFFTFDVLGLTAPGSLPTPHLPLGISFFTFQSISYLVDVYRGRAPASRSLLNVATYIAMFPQLVAGPIVRYHLIVDQLHKRFISVRHIRDGVAFFAIGLAQKVLIANSVAPLVDAIFSLPQDKLTFLAAWAGALGYTLQIYFDFAGYSNMAIGIGLLLGFNFPRNFNYPYIALSITEFWRRWHITLSTWFRDYLYIPLGGNRRGAGRTYGHLFIVFVLCGLWHGAAWTFLFWGLYHGLLLVLERLALFRWLERSPRPLAWLYTIAAVIIGWVLFRADSPAQALNIFQAMAGKATAGVMGPEIRQLFTHETLFWATVGCFSATPLPAGLFNRFANAPVVEKPLQACGNLCNTFTVATAVILIFFSAVHLASGTYNPFIYFRF
jgi:alginate O-acetyltransferase complex protein AlgI